MNCYECKFAQYFDGLSGAGPSWEYTCRRKPIAELGWPQIWGENPWCGEFKKKVEE